MTLLTLPKQHIPLTNRGDVIGADWFRWASDVTERCGGVTGSSTTDLQVAQLEGEETNAEMFRLADALDQAESLIHLLAARVDDLERAVMSINQGTLI